MSIEGLIRKLKQKTISARAEAHTFELLSKSNDFKMIIDISIEDAEEIISILEVELGAVELDNISDPAQLLNLIALNLVNRK